MRAMPLLAGAALAFLLAGCASVDPAPARRAVEADVSARLDRPIAWEQGGPDDRRADAAFSRLLAGPLTADAAVEVALLHNPGLRAAFEEIGVSQADLVQAGLLRNPVFFASARFPDRPPLAGDIELAVTQDFLDLLMKPLQKRMASLELAETKARVGHEALQLAADVRAASARYQARLQQLRRVRLAAETLEAAGDLAAAQEKAGTLSELDAALRAAAGQQAAAETAEAEIDAARDREALNRLMGLEPERTGWTMAETLPPLPPTDPPVTALEARALRERLDLEAAGLRVALLEKALSLKKGTALLPAGVNVGVDSERNPDGSRVTGPTLELQLPLFDQGQASVARLEALLRQAEDRRERLRVDAASAVREAWTAMRAKRRLAETYRRTLLPQREKILRLSQAQYNYMLKSPYDLLEARRAEAETERRALELERDYWIERARLQAAVGGGLNPTPKARS
ncbi:MAG: TolC family protein [Verrucomicrobium sp.]|nr:TolC family protein [Verrucomicrobium sp.]